MARDDRFSGDRHGAGTTLVLHLAPGLLFAATALPLARMAADRGLPPALGLQAAALLVLAPVLVGTIALAAQLRTSSWWIRSLVRCVCRLELRHGRERPRAQLRAGRTQGAGRGDAPTSIRGVFVAYVGDHDYPDFFLARLWAGIAAIHGERSAVDERGRWPVCTIEGLTEGSGLADTQIRPITIDTIFADRQSIWDRFLLGVGPSGQAVGALDPPTREQLRQGLDDDLPLENDGSVRLTGRALAATAVQR